ncbi:MAG: VWA domain-containing protein [Candidatus Bipolaricaulota bacterium]|nr:VWA domain-containing protein [Candidatus Bipolaricaulota bacterium]
MIRFATPLALLALLALGFLVVGGRKRLRDVALPALAALALIVALAGPELRRGLPPENVIVLLDRSPSVVATLEDDEVQDAVAGLRAVNPDRRFGAVAFASRATITDPLSENPSPLSGLPEGASLGARTDVAAAVNLALAASPTGGANQLVLASDGRITDGLLEAVTAARAAGVPISTLPLGHTATADTSFTRLEVPSRVQVARPFQIVAGVESPSPGEGTLLLYRDGELVSSTPVSLNSGLSRFRIVDTLTETGTHTYRVAVKRLGDPIPENDSLSAFAESETPPPLLIVSPEVPNTLAAVLAGAQRPYALSAVVPPLEELAHYREILITGFPLGELSPGDIQILRSFVADLGGGLLVAEGEAELRGVRSGGIEDLLPVSYTLPQRADQASLAVVYLLDRSASMLGHAEGAAKIDVVKEAAAACVGLLDPQALAGIIAFDREFRWLRRVAPVLDGREIYESLRTLEASGGTDIYYPTVAALDALEQVSARIKHILLLSDGKTVDEARDWGGLFARLEAQSDVRLSAIAVGPQPNLSLLDRLAKAGRGELYVAADFSLLPKVSMEATQRLSESRFVTEETSVSGPLVGGDLGEIPPLQGRALTYSRPTAEVLLAAGTDPILARWRLGLGRAAVLNTDLAGIWSRDWLSWSRAPLLLEALLGCVEAGTWVDQGLQPSVEVGEFGIRVSVEARESDGSFADFLRLEAALLPGGTAAPLAQTSAGRYETTLPTLAEGGYALRVVDQTRGRVVLLPFSVPYPEEYRHTGVDKATLRTIAQATGGRFLVGEQVLPESPSALAQSFVPVHRQVLLLALALFLLELVRRKLPRRLAKPAPRTGRSAS